MKTPLTKRRYKCRTCGKRSRKVLSWFSLSWFHIRIDYPDRKRTTQTNFCSVRCLKTKLLKWGGYHVS